MTKSMQYYNTCSLVFVCALLITHIASQKLILVGPFIFTAGILLFPVTFIFSDILTEVWSFRESKRIVMFGFFISAFMSIFLLVIIELPYPSSWPYQEHFATTLKQMPRIVIATLVAYVVGELINNYVLAELKSKHGEKKVALRYVSSTVAGEAVNSLLFVSIAFYGVFPSAILIKTIYSGFLFKVVYEIMALPMSLPLTNWIKAQIAETKE